MTNKNPKNTETRFDNEIQTKDKLKYAPVSIHQSAKMIELEFARPVSKLVKHDGNYFGESSKTYFKDKTSEHEYLEIFMNDDGGITNWKEFDDTNGHELVHVFMVDGKPNKVITYYKDKGNVYKDREQLVKFVDEINADDGFVSKRTSFPIKQKSIRQLFTNKMSGYYYEDHFLQEQYAQSDVHQAPILTEFNQVDWHKRSTNEVLDQNLPRPILPTDSGISTRWIDLTISGKTKYFHSNGNPSKELIFSPGNKKMKRKPQMKTTSYYDNGKKSEQISHSLNDAAKRDLGIPSGSGNWKASGIETGWDKDGEVSSEKDHSVYGSTVVIFDKTRSGSYLEQKSVAQEAIIAIQKGIIAVQGKQIDDFDDDYLNGIATGVIGAIIFRGSDASDQISKENSTMVASANTGLSNALSKANASKKPTNLDQDYSTKPNMIA